jgi:hypothetical protein
MRSPTIKRGQMPDWGMSSTLQKTKTSSIYEDGRINNKFQSDYTFFCYFSGKIIFALPRTYRSWSSDSGHLASARSTEI